MNPLQQLQSSQPQQAPIPPQQAQAAAPSNPLAALAQGTQQQRLAPAPTKAQTVAAVHRFSEIKAALKPVRDDPNLGTKNIRPKLLDAASELLASKVLSLPEIMNAIKGLPDDPMQQKKFVDQIYGTADQAQAMVLQHHRSAQVPDDPNAAQWSPDNHADQMAGLMRQYNG